MCSRPLPVFLSAFPVEWSRRIGNIGKVGWISRSWHVDNPAGGVAGPSGPFAYFTNVRDGTITVIDINTDTVYSTIKDDGRPRGIRLSEDRKKIWVAISGGNDKIIEIDANGNGSQMTFLSSTLPATK